MRHSTNLAYLYRPFMHSSSRRMVRYEGRSGYRDDDGEAATEEGVEEARPMWQTSSGAGASIGRCGPRVDGHGCGKRVAEAEVERRRR